MSGTILPSSPSISAAQLAAWLTDARQRTLELIDDLTDAQLLGPQLSIVNPLLWELGHLAWFHEKWLLRHARGRPPWRDDADWLYDSSAVPHDNRWDLRLPSRAETLRYMGQVHDQILELLNADRLSADDVYFVLLSIFHEDMHAEAFLYGRQTLAYQRPVTSRARRGAERSLPDGRGSLSSDADIPGGTFLLGASPREPFVFDNEQWEHSVEIAPFAIARAPVTQAEFAAFVDDNGYRRRELWDDSGWNWRESANANHPVYWERQSAGWLRRDFDTWLPVEPHRPMLHVNWHEAQAYCRWAGRRLPTEAEWEMAASGPKPSARFPWGDDLPGSDRANLDGFAPGCCDVAERSGGDSVFGCRQMIGNVWEWTASDFLPYPGFIVGPYRDYSQPWFGTHKVLRGGCWATRSRLLRNTWRNFFRPERRDIWAGFRTCKR